MYTTLKYLDLATLEENDVYGMCENMYKQDVLHALVIRWATRCVPGSYMCCITLPFL